jgi:regulator of RNase E activity RraA
MTTQESETQALVALFKGLDTAGVSDSLDKLGIHGQAYGIMPLQDYSDVIVGPAFTVKYVPAGKPAGTVGDYIDDVKQGDIVVIDNAGRTDCTVWGDILTLYAGKYCIAGTVIDGVCRDVSKAISDNYPLFTVGRFMRTGKDRVEVEAVNGTVAIGKVKVQARDIVVADANGVVIVPRKYARVVAQIAHEIEEVEAAIRERITLGDSIRGARAKLGYHTLQRKS